jgi:uncharacterized membrane protein YhaH (DUF805 family)
VAEAADDTAEMVVLMISVTVVVATETVDMATVSRRWRARLSSKIVVMVVVVVPVVLEKRRKTGRRRKHHGQQEARYRG